MASAAPTPDANQGMGGILGWIERSGNKLPDPVFLFFWLIAILILQTGPNDVPGRQWRPAPVSR